MKCLGSTILNRDSGDPQEYESPRQVSQTGLLADTSVSPALPDSGPSLGSPSPQDDSGLSSHSGLVFSRFELSN